MNYPRLLTRGASICLSCRRDLLRRFSSTPAPFAAFQSYPLNPHPQASPRNASVPDTSIAPPVRSPLPKVHETRPPRDVAAVSGPQTPQSSSPISIPEQEAQKSNRDFAEPNQITSASSSSPTPVHPATKASPTPVVTAASSGVSSASTQAPAAKSRSKLRTPRKAAMKLTPAAVTHLRALLDQPDPKLIKVGVRNRGCSGLSYHLEYVDKAGAFDETVEQDGVKVLIDSKALFSIIGSEMDWVEDKLNQRFVFRNPNIKEQCGCGESFMV